MNMNIYIINYELYEQGDNRDDIQTDYIIAFDENSAKEKLYIKNQIENNLACTTITFIKVIAQKMEINGEMFEITIKQTTFK